MNWNLPYNDSGDPNEWQRIKFCEACKEIVTIGQRCAEPECNVRHHNICLAAYWNSRPRKKCPKCEIAGMENILWGKRR